MSQFAGYVLPGSVFIAFGLKWSLDASTDPTYYTATDMIHDNYQGVKKSHKYRRRQSCCFCCTPSASNFPMEGLTKLLITAIGIGASVAAAFAAGKLQHVGDILYATVYLFFSISGLVDILIFYCPYMLPFALDKFALALAFAIEGLMFNLHLGHQAYMEQQVHILLVCAIYSCAFVCLVEIILPWSQLVKFCRAFTTMIHGSWYIQSGFILYNPTKSSPATWSTGDDFNNALIWISLTFAWHCAGAFVILLCLLALSRRRGSYGRRPPMKIINAGSSSRNDVNGEEEINNCPMGDADVQSHCHFQPHTMALSNHSLQQSQCQIAMSTHWPSGNNLKS